MDRITGWKLDPDQRRELLAHIPPRYPNVVADHVTLRAQAGADARPPPDPKAAEIVGEADDGLGVQAMVVRLDGAMDRPGGGTYHITWSLGPGRRAKESNDVIAARGWIGRAPQPVRLRGTVWPR